MDNTRITGLNILDYYGNAVENIEFIEPIEVDLEEFTIRVSNFSFTGTDEGAAEIQCEMENAAGGSEEVSESLIQIMDILLESTDGELEDKTDISQRIEKALELLFIY